ncbi:MAG: rRNA ((527)-N(7))-methyltransferase RsmG [Pseudomonadota bacterium]|jgi:16S rRNA (guanine527-N7)-methyltransferase
MTVSAYEPPLRQGAEALGLRLSNSQIAQLLGYHALIQKWNKVYNLTAIREPGEMLTHHLLDSLAIVAPLTRQSAGASVKMLDVGAGAGLPGVVVAICCPQVSVTCVDAVAKKMAFVQQVATELTLPNLKALHARVETLTDKYDVITSRAFATLLDFVTGSHAALKPANGVWLAMKAKDTATEIAALPSNVDVFHVEQLVVPGLDAERCIVWMRSK